MNYNHNMQAILREHAQTRASKTAVEFGSRKLSYHEFEKQVRALACRFADEGVAKGSVVAICIPNSIEMVIAIYAVLYLRATVLPISAGSPPERMKSVIHDSRPAVVLCGKDLLGEVSRFEVKCLAIDLIDLHTDINTAINCAADISENDYAFCIYTSGTTGSPKGVMLSYSGILNHASAKTDLLNLTQESRICLSFNISFVASIWQMLTPVLLGAVLVVYEGSLIRKPYQFFMQIEKDGLPSVSMTPHTMSAYIEYVANDRSKVPLRSLRYIVLTGEKLYDKLVLRFYKLYEHITLINAYGQTECSDDTYHYVIPRSFTGGNVPIGSPIQNITGHVFDGDMADSDFGELYISGAGVANGYLRNKGLTDAKFVKLPMHGFTVFKTGDLVRKADNGILVYIGRTDNQVKIRGYRVEPEEVEGNIIGFQGITQTVVRCVSRNSTDKFLEALYAGSKTVDKNALAEFLRKRLPDYMIPAKFTQIESFPSLPNGKIDRTGFIVPDAVGVEDSGSIDGFDEPHITGIPLQEDDLQGRFCCALNAFLLNTLGISDAAMQDTFEDIGIHSLLFVQLVIKLETEFGIVFDDEHLLADSFRSIGDVYSYVKENSTRTQKHS